MAKQTLTMVVMKCNKVTKTNRRYIDSRNDDNNRSTNGCTYIYIYPCDTKLPLKVEIISANEARK